eukprot:6212347-Pleurochrysis_carterae.AAC.4
MHQSTNNVGFIASKDKFPTAQRSYLVRNQGNHGCHFAGGSLYRDNEIVLNSAKIGLVLKEFDMYHTNCCQYEPLYHHSTAIGCRALFTGEQSRSGSGRSGGAGRTYGAALGQGCSRAASGESRAWGAERERSASTHAI